MDIRAFCRTYVRALTDVLAQGDASEESCYSALGVYQACHKWLNGRKGCVLSLDEIRTYCRIVTALGKTIAIQKEIEALCPIVEGNLL
jgi:hypothetical protein